VLLASVIEGMCSSGRQLLGALVEESPLVVIAVSPRLQKPGGARALHSDLQAHADCCHPANSWLEILTFN
jgi:hypothetical protein